ncbi:MAG: M67 family metallopeptidase [Anaerolineae bacterium]|nr:M67 family metallopeptidase [Anaerolineae bacterium]
MALQITAALLDEIHAHGESAYPEEGAGLLLGRAHGAHRQVQATIILSNAREDAARRNRYLITPQDMLAAEQHAARLGLDVIGVFHSHPDHPNQPSDFDRDWALPWFSYLITSVAQGRAAGSRSWRLSDDRQVFTEEPLDTSHP